MKETLGLLPPEAFRKMEIPRPGGDTIAAFRALSNRDWAGLVARMLDRIGVTSTIPASILKPVKPGSLVIGPAITVRNIPTHHVPLHAWEHTTKTLLGEREAFFLAEEGDVVVIDGESVFPASCLGSMSTNLAASLGVAGIIVSGAVTGAKGIREAPIPVWARSGTTITGHQRIETVEINGPIGFHNVRVEAGDLVVADDSGVTFIPHSLIDTVLRLAEAVKVKGSRIDHLLKSNGDREEMRVEIASFLKSL